MNCSTLSRELLRVSRGFWLVVVVLLSICAECDVVLLAVLWEEVVLVEFEPPMQPEARTMRSTRNNESSLFLILSPGGGRFAPT